MRCEVCRFKDEEGRRFRLYEFENGFGIITARGPVNLHDGEQVLMGEQCRYAEDTQCIPVDRAVCAKMLRRMRNTAGQPRIRFGVRTTRTEETSPCQLHHPSQADPASVGSTEPGPNAPTSTPSTRTAIGSKDSMRIC